MELTQEKLYQDYKDLISGRKYWAIVLIMSPVFILIGVMGGSIALGVFMIVAMCIFMFFSTINSRIILKRLKKGNFTLRQDVLVSKITGRSYKKGTSYWSVKSEKLYPKGYRVLPYDYDSVEEGQPFVALYAGRKFVRLYGLTTNTLGQDVLDKII